METNSNKTCSKCQQEKSLTEYGSNGRGGRQTICKTCRAISLKIWRSLNVDKTSSYNKKRNGKYNKEKTKINQKKYRNTESAKLTRQKWNEKNKDKIKEIKQRHIKKARQNTTRRISDSLSCSIRIALHEKKNGRSWESIVGYTTNELMCHLESKFDSNMNWDNYGTYWHIDHIKPQSWFTYTDVSDVEFKECWALKNLQPLEKTQNMSKGNRYEGDYQSELSLKPASSSNESSYVSLAQFTQRGTCLPATSVQVDSSPSNQAPQS